MSTLLFVYGTLKRGERNHHRLGGSRFVGEARTRPRYRMFRIDWYPGLVECADGAAIEGELWLVEEATLRQLDDYEGVPTWFARQAIEIEGEARRVEAYYYQGEVAGKEVCGVRWS